MSTPNEGKLPKDDSKNIQQLESISKMLLTLASALVAIIGIRMIAQELISPILLAGFIAVLIYPIFRAFRKRGRSSWMSLVLMLLTLGVGFLAFGLFLTWSFDKFFDSIDVYIENFVANLETYLAELDIAVDENLISQENVEEVIQLDPVRELASQGDLLGIVSSLVGGIWNLFYLLIFIPFLAILMMLQFDSIPKKTTSELIKESSAVRKMQKFADSIIIYIVARGKVNLFTGALFAVALAIIGVDFALLWGLIVAILSFIPYIGIVVASIPPVVIALASIGWVGALLVIVSVIIVNVLAENVIDPYVQGQSNKISAVTIIVMLIFWTWLLGPVGAILSVPLTVLIKLVLEDYKETRWMAKIMEGNYAAGDKASKESKLVMRVRKRFSRNK